MKKELPGLANFYMVGQWVSPGGGLPSGLMTGNHVVQILCKKDRKRFKASEPVAVEHQNRRVATKNQKHRSKVRSI